ncbi:glycoside hydrolase [Anaeromyces robustus]|uniref:Arabinogalactan endo-beta-1,4-galactanase n=1 Tax=Anaeromyces robustus TaxID=1754192 RepID=A0A1Y1XIK3_9FUNG|nr:glycoside hydrolase [Anaeromyces robustus]|eukprot:ORX85598.1 glycoside hydrolase [Anaeromyces robustus]
MALSVSPFTNKSISEGYTYEYNEKQITTVEELEKLYIEKGATEMYVRIATKRHVTKDDITDGEIDTNANVHTFDQAIELCRIAAKLNIPINPEVMCAYTYMDMEKQQAPRFNEYPEIYELQKGKDWSELSLDEIVVVLKEYGKFIATEILNTNCTVNNWNLGNEANFGFAGVSLGLKTAVNKNLEDVSDFKRYTLPLFNVRWLEKNIWQYNAKQFVAVKEGILEAYKQLGIDSTNVKFSTHIATVVMTPGACARYFKCMKKNGYAVDTAGISFYPSAPSMYLNPMILYKKTVREINNECKVPVFIGEFSYPSGEMSGDFAGWNKKANGYQHTEEGQASIYKDVVDWGKTHGVNGIRYWAADYEDWGSMGLFKFENKHGTPKKGLLQDIISK